MSPTSVYSRRSSDPNSAAATSPLESPRPSPNVREALFEPALVDLRLEGVHVERGADGSVGVVGLGDRRAEDRHHGIADELHDGTPFAKDRPVHCGAMRVELTGELARVSVLGDC